MSVGHVLLTILAVIGWTLLAILALIILLLLIVLLVPIRYKANAHVTRRKEEFEADVKPYLTVTLADATKPFYKPGEPVALNWKL